MPTAYVGCPHTRQYSHMSVIIRNRTAWTCLHCSSSSLPAGSKRQVTVTALPDQTVQLNSSNTQPGSTPLVDAIMDRGGQDDDAPFHVPGHKKGQNVHSKFQQLLDKGMLKHDLTETSGLDYLASPSGVIKQAQLLAAATFSADRTWFLVNGSSVGIHAAIMSLVGPEETLMVARNCHQSAFAGMTLSGCTPWWLQPEIDNELGIANCVAPTVLRAALEEAAAKCARIAAVLIVSPTYYGVCADVEGLAEVCHSYSVPLIVDEAHGAHLGLHPQLPASAMQQGADVAIQSTHKVLSAMTQAAMLHVQGPRVDRTRISRALQMLQSSSPSYVLMASLDAARAHADEPELCFGQALLAAKVAAEGLSSIPGISLLAYPSTHTSQHMPTAHVKGHQQAKDVSQQESMLAEGTRLQQDPLRLTVCVSGLGVTGYDASTMLEEQHSVVPELATQQVVVLVLGPGSTTAHAQQLVHAFKALSTQLLQRGAHGTLHAASNSPASQIAAPATTEGPVQTTEGLPVRLGSQSTMQLTPRAAFFAPSERIRWMEAVGRVSAELLCPYPPGVPVVYPGELITAEALDILQGTLRSGGKVTGASDDSLQTLVVVRD